MTPNPNRRTDRGDAPTALPPKWQDTPRHPEHPGAELGVVAGEDGATILYERDNPNAWVRGETYLVGERGDH